MSHQAGPLLNRIQKPFTSRDPLGIEGVAATIQGEICPVVNTVTPRAFYWPFMIWLYYDFYKNSGIKKQDYKHFDAFLKRQDYFFVLSNLLIDGSDRDNLVGKTQTEVDIRNNRSGEYNYNPGYFKTRFGGMQYYNAGCISMHYVIDRNIETDQAYPFPKMHRIGEEMAIAFESVIKDTTYYKKYRLSQGLVPQKALYEYGKVINLPLRGFDQCKVLLKSRLFETKENGKLSESAKYLQFLHAKFGIEDYSNSNLRYVLYDYFSPRAEGRKYDKELSTIIKQWEIVVGRQYLTAGIGMIFKYMLDELYTPMDISNWVHTVITDSEIPFDLDQKLSSIIEDCNYEYDKREAMVSDARKGASESVIANGLKLILSVYNRFKERSDYGEEEKYLYYDSNGNSISIVDVIETVNSHKDKTILEFLKYVIKTWVLDQHLLTATEKLLQNRDGFCFEIVDEQYRLKHSYDVYFKGIRLTQLSQVMRDLDML